MNLNEESKRLLDQQYKELLIVVTHINQQRVCKIIQKNKEDIQKVNDVRPGLLYLDEDVFFLVMHVHPSDRNSLFVVPVYERALLEYDDPLKWEEHKAGFVFFPLPGYGGDVVANFNEATWVVRKVVESWHLCKVLEDWRFQLVRKKWLKLNGKIN